MLLSVIIVVIIIVVMFISLVIIVVILSVSCVVECEQQAVWLGLRLSLCRTRLVDAECSKVSHHLKRLPTILKPLLQVVLVTVVVT